MGDLRQRSLSDAFSTTSSKKDSKNVAPNVADSSDEISYVAAENLEAEIALLIASGYSRDTAVKILLERKRANDRGNNGGVSLLFVVRTKIHLFFNRKCHVLLPWKLSLVFLAAVATAIA